MKLAVFGHKHINTREGGIEVVVTELYNRIGNHCDVTVYDRKELDRKTKKDPRPHPYKIKGSPTLSNGKVNAVMASFFSTLQCKFGHYDVIHVHAEGPCAFLPLIKKKKIVATVHGLDWNRAKWGKLASKFIKTGEKNMVKYADKIIVLSEDMKKYFQDTYGRETILVENGVTVEKYNGTNPLTKLGLKPRDYILYVGRIVPEKRLDLLINAYKLSGIPQKLVIAGKIPDNPDSHIEFAMRDPDIIMTGFTTGDLLKSLYTHAGLIVLPSDLEGMSISLLEGMAYGGPCLASDIPENLETLQGFGYTFQKGDLKSLTESLKNLSKKPFAFDDEMVQFIDENHNWDTIAEQTWEILKQCAEYTEPKAEEPDPVAEEVLEEEPDNDIPEKTFYSQEEKNMLLRLMHDGYIEGDVVKKYVTVSEEELNGAIQDVGETFPDDGKNVLCKN